MESLQSNHIQGSQSWWSRPAGAREVLVVAIPLVVSSLSWTVMTFIDRMFLSKVSGAAMAASFFASVVWFAVFSLPLGICSYGNTFVSQYFGDRQFNRIGPSVWQSVWMAGIAIPLAIIAILFAPMIFNGETEKMEIEYFQILCIGGPAMVLAQAFSCFYGGQGKTWVVMVVDGLVTALNLLLDYLMIFGYWGFPEMGIVGAGWATVIAFWIKVVVYLVLVLQKKHRTEFNTNLFRLDKDLFGRLFYYGGPSGWQMLLDVLGFTVFVMMVGKLGYIEREATTLAFSISTLAFMPIFGFGIAGSVLVGQHLGEDRDDLASRATWTTFQIAGGYIMTLSFFYIFTPQVFLYGFFDEQKVQEGVDLDAIRTMAANLLCFVAAYNLFDAMLHVFSSALKGAGDTRFIFLVSFVMSVTLALLSWLVIDVLHANIYGSWTLVTAWVWALGITYLARFLQGKWRSMRVIEVQHGQSHDSEPTDNVLRNGHVTEVEPLMVKE